MRQGIEEGPGWIFLALLVSKLSMYYNVEKNFKVKNNWG